MPTTETPIRLAIRATALLTADAMPASPWSASASTVAVRGATVSVSPNAKTSIPGSSSVKYEMCLPSRSSGSSPAAATSGPAPMKRRGLYRSASAPKRRESANVTSVTGSVASPACSAV